MAKTLSQNSSEGRMCHFIFKWFELWINKGCNHSLFFIPGHVLGGSVKVTDGDCRLLKSFRYHYTTVSISYGKSDPCIAYLQEFLLTSCLCLVMKRPSSEEWCISVSPWFIIDVERYYPVTFCKLKCEFSQDYTLLIVR
jgi:hypothetical protein